ncbi:MAG TPA: RpiB/LacA/LacB family sugar-phosphate isomerase [Pyrinomonadaceae bacterium]|nr:RpiB/LacA/LacB family sugar-phosphate isomerase [Pyrinomonadaceae bacterium]
MSQESKETRERIKALVREILRTVPEDEQAKAAEFPHRIVVNSLKERTLTEFDRDESAKILITEDDLRGLPEDARVRVAENARFTPLAQDLIREKNIKLIRKSPRVGEIRARTVAIGADHGGYQAKEALKGLLSGLGLVVHDFGTGSTDPVDYPDFAHAVAQAVGNNRADLGIIVDGAGIGSAMAANKVPNVRAAACYSVVLAKNSREHNGANVLTLGSGQNSVSELEEIVRAFLTSEIIEDRHKNRVGKIVEIERKYSR